MAGFEVTTEGQSDVLLGTDAKGAFLMFGPPGAKESMALSDGSFSLDGSAGMLSVDVDDFSAPSRITRTMTGTIAGKKWA